MLYLIAEALGFPGILNLVRYLSFRTGGAVATVLCTAFSWLCAFYVEQIVELGATYGSVGAVVVLLIWLSWNVNAVFYGGAFATEIEILERAKGMPDLDDRPSASVVSLEERRASKR